MKCVVFYNPDTERTISKVEDLNFKTLEEAGSMKGRVTFKDETVKIGYIEASNENKKVGLVTLKKINENTHEIIDKEMLFEEINYDDIEYVEAILFSGLRWDGPPSNLFQP